MKTKQKGSRNALRVLLSFLLCITLTGAAYLGYLAYRERADRRDGTAYYHSLQTAMTTAVNTTVPSTGEDAPWAEPNQAATEPIPSVKKSRLDFASLGQNLPDLVGWLRIEGTVINYPVVQGEDNDYYLHHLPDGRPNKAGSIMMDCTNNRAFTDQVTILHGHHMRNGAMFSSLEKYLQQAYYSAHPRLELYTPTGDYLVQIAAACRVDGYTYGYQTSFQTEAAFTAFVQAAQDATPYPIDLSVTSDDRLLLLSTCNYAFDGARFLLLGKLTPMA